MTKVIFVLPVLQPAGAERVVAELARRLPEHGYSTEVICLEDERAPIGDELIPAGVPVRGLRLSRRRTLACAKALAALLPAERPLILHAHLFHANMAARLAATHVAREARKSLHVVSTIHVAERRFRPWQFALDRITARYSRCEVCVSHAVARFHQKQTGLPQYFFRVIENGIDLQQFLPREPQTGPAREVVAVGRLDPQKDYPTLLNAWKFVEEAHPEARLSIAGDGPEEPNLKVLAGRLHLRRVNFLGFVKDVAALLRTADVFAQSSAWEGFGLTVAEAMACSLPVVVTDADSLPELVTHERTGLVVHKGDAQALATAILRLLQGRAEAAALGQAARVEALRRFSIQRMIQDYARLYQELVCAPSP
ncbi:MAG TPA: glycosyltransferase [Planctomycetota bacterium]|jgi:glycosyltransferase involved in cell wall biosynthesis